MCTWRPLQTATCHNDASIDTKTLSRDLGDSERAFVRGAGADGVGDMFLHLEFYLDGSDDCQQNDNCPIRTGILVRQRVIIAWAIIRLLQPLLMCRVDVTTEQFQFTPSQDIQALLDSASDALTYDSASRMDLILTHMNGPRAHLSHSHLSHLIVSCQAEDDARPNNPAGSRSRTLYHIFLTAPHFIGDGTSLHQSAHELLVLLSSSRTDEELRQDLLEKWHLVREHWSEHLPPPFEHRLPSSTASHNRLAAAATKVNFLQVTQREIGGHTLPRLQPTSDTTADHPSKGRCTKFFERVFEEDVTRLLLKRCKDKGVSVNHLVMAACAAAWSLSQRQSQRQSQSQSQDPHAGPSSASNSESEKRLNSENYSHHERASGDRLPPVPNWREMSKSPIMFYTAINLRSYLSPMDAGPLALPPTYWFLPLTYYTVSLPAYLPSSSSVQNILTEGKSPELTQLLWVRAHSAKLQTTKIVKSRWLCDRARIMAAKRAAPSSNSVSTAESNSKKTADSGMAWKIQKEAHLPPHALAAEGYNSASKALLGVSLIGNLDRVYLREQYCQSISSASVTSNPQPLETSTPRTGIKMELKSVTTASKLKRGGILFLAHTFCGKLWFQVVWDGEAFEEGLFEHWVERVERVVEGVL